MLLLLVRQMTAQLYAFLMMLFNEQNRGVFHQLLGKVLMSLNGEVCMQRVFSPSEMKFITVLRRSFLVFEIPHSCP